MKPALWISCLLLPLLAGGCASTGKSDKQFNWFSDSNGVTSIGEGGPHPYSAPWPSDNIFQPDSPSQYSAILKIGEGTANLSKAVTVAQGNQDSLNLNNHAHDNRFSGDFGLGESGLRVFTIKGGSNDNAVSGVAHNHGTSEDIKVGDWSDQTGNYSINNDLSGLKASDGKKLNVVLMHARKTKLGPNEHVLIFKTIEGKAYWWFKWSVRKILGIPWGTPGPSWLS
jgi:hypothetical protein